MLGLATLWAKFQGIYQIASDDPNLGLSEGAATKVVRGGVFYVIVMYPRDKHWASGMRLADFAQNKLSRKEI